MTQARAVLLAFILGAVPSLSVAAEAPAGPAASKKMGRGVFCGKDDQLMEMRDGKATPAASDVVLESGVKVTTKCVGYTSSGERIDKLRAGDGLLMDGTMAVRMLKGKPMLIAPGRSPRPLTKDIVMMNGVIAKPDGTVVTADGSKRKLIDHEAISANGRVGAAPAQK